MRYDMCDAKLWKSPDIKEIYLGENKIPVCLTYQRSKEETSFVPSDAACPGCECNLPNAQRRADEIARIILKIK